MNDKNKKLRIFLIIIIGIVLGMADRIIIMRRIDISRNIINTIVFLVIVLSSFSISRFLSEHFWKSLILSCILMYLIYWFLYITALIGRLSQWEQVHIIINNII